MPANRDALIQMRRSNCPGGDCAVYSLSVFMDGTVVYDGRANVGVVGQRQSKISAEGVSGLISTLDAMSFLDIPETCCVCRAASGYQIITVDYRPGSVQRTVVHDSGCSSAPRTVAELEREIDRATGSDRWTSPAAGAVASAPKNAGAGVAVIDDQASVPTAEPTSAAVPEASLGIGNSEATAAETGTASPAVTSTPAPAAGP